MSSPESQVPVESRSYRDTPAREPINLNILFGVMFSIVSLFKAHKVVKVSKKSTVVSAGLG